jgi:FkbM family methyltransferase
MTRPLRNLVRGLVPERIRARWQLRLLVRREWRDGEPEIRLLAGLGDRGRAALDIGANRGVYAWYLRRYAKRVHAFEPNPRLARRVGWCLAPAVTVWNLALSDRSGRATLRIPTVEGVEVDGCSTIETGVDAPSGGVETIDVEARPLDDLDLADVGFVKIDVEGHELAVLRGGRRLLARDRPVLLVEIEERHRPGALREATGMLEELGYRGFFLLEGRLRELEEFDPSTLQDPANVGLFGRLPGRVYVNNFLFLPDPGAQERAKGIAPAKAP